MSCSAWNLQQQTQGLPCCECTMNICRDDIWHGIASLLGVEVACPGPWALRHLSQVVL